MSYKTILVHVTPGAAGDARIRFAAALAREAGAHLVGSCPSGVSRFIPSSSLAGGGSALAMRCAELRRDAGEALARFERLAGEEAVASWEARFIDDEAGAGLALQARYCNLVVVGQADRDVAAPMLPSYLPGYLIVNGGRPVLVAPAGSAVLAPQGAALLAWNGSVEATRAAAAALPLLRSARCTTVLGLDDGTAGADLAACRELAAWLKRQGVAARADCRAAADDAGEVLLAAAADNQAGLLVMGGYGRTRLRELVLGGVTATVLRGMTLPVLFGH
ncbi:universal stress protein [Massilia aerilata]|uniref:Universal stress protein n=1 Tax=Massilia aerilata TaxID=453817 RepID=A0ABW0RQK4_9BURK